MTNPLPFDLAKAIDFCDSAFVLLDNDFIVQYLNYKAFNFFLAHEEDFQLIQPNFYHYDIHNKKLEFLISFLDKLNFLSEINDLQLGDNLTFIQHVNLLVVKIKITPIYDGKNKRTGHCIEFADVSSLYKAKEQFDLAIGEGIKGHFSYQVDISEIEKTHPLFYSVYSKINSLFQVLDRFVTDLSGFLEHISHGDLTHCNMELALIPEPRQDQLGCSTCNNFSNCLKKNYINPIESYSFQEDNYLHTIKRDLHYTLQNVWTFVSNIQENQHTLELSIRSITESYSEIAMSTETEFIKSHNIQDLIGNRITTLNHINSEIDQATHIRDVTQGNQEIIQTLKKTLHTVGEQIIYISHIAQTLDNIFAHHSDGLKTGLRAINQGDIGKGIAIINEQSNEIIAKSKDAMSQIRESITQMSFAFSSSNSSIDDIVNAVVDKMNSMDEQIQMFSLLMSSIQDAVKHQEKTTTEMKVFTQDIKNLLSHTVGQIECMIYSTSDLVNLHLQLKESSQAFKIHKQPYPVYVIKSIAEEN